jgi:signal transduction histidine kinase
MKKILVVEDEPDVRTNIKQLLEAEDYCVITAKDGEEGLSLALSETPDMILSDIKMPRVNGTEMLESIQKEDSLKNIPFLFLSAKVDLQDIRKGMSLGADDYIAKPFKVQDLLDAVELRFRKRNIMMVELEEIRESLIRRIPHELRTPLVGILGFSELLADDIESFSKEEILQLIQKINQTGKRLHNIIEKYLLFAEMLEIDKDKHALEKILLNAYEIDNVTDLSLILKNIKNRERIKDIDINLEKCIIAMSDTHFNTILKELLENAIKFSEKETPIKLQGKVLKGKYELSIEDFGIGMPQVSLESIKSFRQFKPNHNIYAGVGLGLAIVKKIVELTNSNMVIKSIIDKGTKVKITIPLK